MTPTQTFEEMDDKFDKDFPPFRGRGAQFPIFNESPNRNWIKFHIRDTVIAVLKAEIERVGEDVSNEFEDDDIAYLAKIARSEERARHKANLQETVDNLTKNVI